MIDAINNDLSFEAEDGTELRVGRNDAGDVEFEMASDVPGYPTRTSLSIGADDARALIEYLSQLLEPVGV